MTIIALYEAFIYYWSKLLNSILLRKLTAIKIDITGLILYSRKVYAEEKLFNLAISYDSLAIILWGMMTIGNISVRYDWLNL